MKPKPEQFFHFAGREERSPSAFCDAVVDAFPIISRDGQENAECYFAGYQQAITDSALQPIEGELIRDFSLLFSTPPLLTGEDWTAHMEDCMARAAKMLAHIMVDGQPAAPLEVVDTCPKCGHAWHIKPCLNSSSDSDCSCKSSEPSK